MTAMVVLGGAAGASAQDAVSLAVPDPYRWDVAGEVGWLSGNKSEIGPEWDDWYDEASGALSVGRYFTPHLRGEVRAAVGGEARIFEEQREHYFRSTTLGTGIHYQLFENQYFHPLVGAGVELHRESDRVVVQRWPLYGSGPNGSVVPAVPTTTTLSWAVRPFVSAGFKWYVGERGFVRSDVRAAIGRGRVASTSWTFGIGVDL